jgi:hypothetical protein
MELFLHKTVYVNIFKLRKITINKILIKIIIIMKHTYTHTDTPAWNAEICTSPHPPIIGMAWRYRQAIYYGNGEC